MKKWVLLVAGLAVVVGATYLARWKGVDLVALSGFGSNQPPAATQGQQPQGKPGKARGPMPVEIARSVTKQLSNDISAIGTVLAEDSVMIAPETSGRIAEILFKDGDIVKQGTPLFRLDAELANAALAEAQARLSLAEANFNRNQTLRKSGNIAASTFDAAATELEVARAAVESTRVNLGKLTISAPFGGALGFRTISLGAYVNAGAALVQLDAVRHLKVSFAVPELQQGFIAIGQQVEVVIDAMPGEKFTATVSGIAPSIDVNGRSLLVRADLDNAEMKLRPGFLARVIVKGPQRDAVVVPEAAIVQRGDKAFLYVVDNNKAREVKVQTGLRAAGSVEVSGAVPAGASVVVAGQARIADGAAVEIVKGPAAVE